MIVVIINLSKKNIDKNKLSEDGEKLKIKFNKFLEKKFYINNYVCISELIERYYYQHELTYIKINKYYTGEELFNLYIENNIDKIHEFLIKKFEDKNYFNNNKDKLTKFIEEFYNGKNFSFIINNIKTQDFDNNYLYQQDFFQKKYLEIINKIGKINLIK